MSVEKPLGEKTTRVVLINGKSARAIAVVRWLSGLSALEVESLDHEFERSWFRPRSGDVLVFDVGSLKSLQEFTNTARLYHAGCKNFGSILMISANAIRMSEVIAEFPNTFVVEGDPKKNLAIAPSILGLVQAHHAQNQVTEDKRNPFQPISSIREKAKILKDALHTKAPITLSPANSKVVIKGRFFDLDPATGAFIFQVPEEATVGLPLDSKVAITLSLKQSRIFFWAPTLTVRDATTISVDSPAELYAVQRRGDFRWQVPVQACQFNVGGRLIRTQLVDVSMGGVAITCHKDDLPVLQQASVLRDFEFMLDGHKVRVSQLQLRHSTVLDDGSTARIGYKFEEISAVSSRQLSEFLEGRSREYFQTYLVAKAS